VKVKSHREMKLCEWWRDTREFVESEPTGLHYVVPQLISSKPQVLNANERRLISFYIV